MNGIKNYFIKNKLIFFLLCALILPLLLGNFLPHTVKEFFYSISVSLKQIITFILPVMIFSFLSNTLISIGKKAIFFMILLFATIYLSNLTAILTGYYVGSSAINYMSINQINSIDLSSNLHLLWDLHLTQIVANEVALGAGLFVGFVLNFIHINPIKVAINKMNKYSLFFLRQVFLPILPIFILGFIIKLDHDNLVNKMFTVFGSAIFIILSLQISYVLLLFSISQGFHFKNTMIAIRNVLPATFTGFTTISSAASIPINIICTEKNVKNPEIVKTIIPLVANIHTLGSALGITVLLTFIMHTFGFTIPAPHVFISFAMVFAMSKFAVAGIPGGVILVISPILESTLGFSPEMIGLITSLYFLIDPVGTSVNVTCNSAFTVIISKTTDMFNFGKSTRLDEQTSSDTNETITQ